MRFASCPAARRALQSCQESGELRADRKAVLEAEATFSASAGLEAKVGIRRYSISASAILTRVRIKQL